MNLKNALAMGLGVALLGSLSSLHAADAVLVQKSGTVTATLPNGTTKELSQGDVVPEGSTISTSAGSVANIEPVAGAVATLQGSSSVKIDKIAVTQDANGTVTRQEVLLDLTSGDLVATIDPSKRAINDFKVHTPKGVAAARGTSFSISLGTDGKAGGTGGGSFSVATTADSVQFTAVDGSSFSVSAGQITMTSSTGVVSQPVSLASAAASNPAIAALMTQAVAAVSNVVQNNLGGLSSEAALNVMTQVVGVASNANPSQSAAYASTAATAVTSPTAATNANGNGTAAAAQVAAAAAAAVPGSSVEIAAAVTTAVTKSSGSTDGTAVSASIAGTISASVAGATGQSVATVSQGVAAQTGNNASAVASAASTASSTTVNAAANTASGLTTAQSTASTAIITTPITVNAVSPSG